MSAARTARRRRSQYRLGAKGLAQIYGGNRAPKYPGVVSKEKSARILAQRIATERNIKSGVKKG